MFQNKAPFVIVDVTCTYVGNKAFCGDFFHKLSGQRHCQENSISKWQELHTSSLLAPEDCNHSF